MQQSTTLRQEEACKHHALLDEQSNAYNPTLIRVGPGGNYRLYRMPDSNCFLVRVYPRVVAFEEPVGTRGFVLTVFPWSSALAQDGDDVRDVCSVEEMLADGGTLVDEGCARPVLSKQPT